MLIAIHVALLVISIVATVVSTIAAAFGVQISKMFNRINILVTTVGISAGVILLIDKPLGVRCITLTAYLALFGLTQVYIRRRNKRLSATTL